MGHFLDDLFNIQIQDDGVDLPKLGTLNFVGFTLDYDEDEGVITVEGGGELDGPDVEGALDDNRIVQISGDEEDNEVSVEAVAFIWDESASAGVPELKVSTGEEEGGALEITHQGDRVALFHAAGMNIGNAEAINRILGGLRCTTQTISSSPVTLDATSTAQLIMVTASAPRTIVLPTPAVGRMFFFFITGSSAVTLQRNGSEQINGVAGNYTVPQANSLVVVTCESGNWFARCFAEGAGGSSQEAAIVFSAVDTLLVDNNAPQGPAGDQTDGTMFFVRPGSNVNITGIRFYWHPATNETVKCALYSNAGALLASVNVVTSGAGIYTGTFASPILCDAAGAGAGAFNRRLIAAVHDVAGGKYTKYDKTSLPSTTWPALPFFGGRRIGWINFALWKAGDVAPDTTAATEVYPVEPVLVEL